MSHLKPGIIRVSSGGLHKNIKASTPFEAFKIFIEKYKPKSLGQLVEFKGLVIDDPEHICYSSTQRLLEKMGKWSDEPLKGCVEL
jgi:hypothetical protein